MVGRGTRLADNKLMFTIYDYTDATRLFGEGFVTKPTKPSKGGDKTDPPVIVKADGFEAEISDAGRFIVIEIDGQVKRITVEEYKAGIAKRVVENAGTIEDFRAMWVDPQNRRTLINDLIYSGYSPEIVRRVESMTAFDLYDVLVDIAYGAEPKTREQRVFSFSYKQKTWLSRFPIETRAVILAIANQFTKEGTDALESGYIFNAKEVREAGGMKALKLGGDAAELMRQTKERMFAA